jgi:hypothetical protein
MHCGLVSQKRASLYNGVAMHRDVSTKGQTCAGKHITNSLYLKLQSQLETEPFYLRTQCGDKEQINLILCTHFSTLLPNHIP